MKIMRTASKRSKQLAAASRKRLFFSMSFCAFSYALTMTLARTSRENLSAAEIDGLCQLAYELLNKLTKTSEVFQEARQKLEAYMKKGFAAALIAAIMAA